MLTPVVLLLAPVPLPVAATGEAEERPVALCPGSGGHTADQRLGA